MPEESKPKRLDAEGWARMLVGTAITIVTAWRLFVADIHGYIDTVSEREQEKVTNAVHGHMLILMDSINAAAVARDSAVWQRMDRMDSTHRVLQDQNRAILHGLERMLDVGYAPN
ncbi:MAG: hypothetical protein QY325_04400 [Flavobacteriales bacterium]|nr:MAG: hypothetical protein QY325_04400 [Flavobacteriales bacterium]